MSFKLDSKLLNFDKVAKKETTDDLTQQFREYKKNI